MAFLSFCKSKERTLACIVFASTSEWAAAEPPFGLSKIRSISELIKLRNLLTN